MKRASLLFIGLICFSVVVFAGEVITNDTGEEATGLRVAFSSPVLITAFGDILTSVDPQMLSFEFVFSGGTVEPWGSHWLNWAPTTVSVVEYEWFTDPATAESPPGNLPNTPAPTYDEIMAQIAEYPGAYEPLYVPGPDKAIWLTDLEGHADIYDNDSIRINYADWFDKNQITRIVIKRNGISMGFLSDILDVDVLTNDQMKTFDGNPLEHSPASEHTDHAIFGYEYHFEVFAETARYTATISVKAPFHYSGEVAVNFGGGHETDIRVGNWPYAWMVERFEEFKAMGYEAIAFQVYYFMHSAHANEVFAMYEQDRSIHSFASTLEDKHIRDILRAIDAAGLDAELRIEIWVSDEAETQEDYSHRGALRPSDLNAWFGSYGDICEHLGRIMEEEGGDLFTPMVELSLTETHESHVRGLLDRIRTVYGGRLSVGQQTNTHMALGSGYSTRQEELATPWERVADRATFWDYDDLEIGLDCWQSGVWETQNDQRFSILVENLVAFWARAIGYYREKYPDQSIRFAELGAFYFDSSSRGYDWWLHYPERRLQSDFQELSDLWAAYLYMAEYLDVNEISAFGAWPYREEWRLQDYDSGDWMLGGRSAERCLVEMIGGTVEAIPCMLNRGIVCGQEGKDD